jgi:RNA polymerase sigma factor (sigma-70 family)
MNSGDPALAGSWIPDLFSGNSDDIWMLWHRNKCHVERVLRASFRLSQWDMEEVLSITMLKFYEQFPRHCGKIKNLSAWLARLAQNATTDHLRKERRRQQRYQNLDEAQLYCALVETSLVSAPEPQHESKESLDFMFQGLSATLRETAIAHFVEGRKYREIADAQQVQVATIRKRIQSIREHLRGEWSKQAQEEALAPGIPGRHVSVASRIFPGPASHDLFVHIFFQRIPSRSQQRAATLQRYLSKRRPRDPGKWLDLAEMHLAAGDWTKALDCYEACHKKYPSLIEAAWRAAQLHLILDNQSRAHQLSREMVRSARSPAREHLLRGYCSWIEGNLLEARTAWERAALLEPENPDHHMRLFHVLMAEGRSEAARSRIDRVLVISSEHHRAMNLILPSLHASGEHALLKHYASLLYAKGDRNAAVVKYYADCRLQEDDCTPEESDSLRRQVTQALETAPGFPGLLDTRARQLQGVGGSLRLFKFLDAMIESHPSSASAWTIRAIWMCHLGHTAQAIAAAGTARSLTPRVPGIMAAMAWVATCRNVRELSVEVLDCLVAAGAACPRLALSAAIVSAIVFQNMKQALELSELALRSGSADPFIVYGHGRILAQAGWIHEAIHAFQSAWEMVLPRGVHVLMPHLEYDLHTTSTASRTLPGLECERNATAARPAWLGLPPTRRRQKLGPLLLSDLLLFFARCYDSATAVTIPL